MANEIVVDLFTAGSIIAAHGDWQAYVDSLSLGTAYVVEEVRTSTGQVAVDLDQALTSADAVSVRNDMDTTHSKDVGSSTVRRPSRGASFGGFA